MRQATDDWVGTIGIAFQHLADLDDDGGVGPGGAVFAVRGINANGSFIGRRSSRTIRSTGGGS